MPTYRREVRIDAPLEEVWAFHSRASGLTALTPDWLNLRVEEIRLPDGESTRDRDAVLAAGTEIRLSVRPLGVGPRRSWTSRIVRRDEGEGSAVFEDEMVDGPFPKWRHRHAFFAGGSGPTPDASGERSDLRADETLVRDRVTYELPVVGGLLGPIGWLGFEPTFRERHRRTKRLLEGKGRGRGDPGAGRGDTSAGTGDDDASAAEHQRSE